VSGTRGAAVAKRQLGVRLRRVRANAKMTQTQLAKALDWSPSKVLRIENGQVAVATSDLLALITLYAVPDETSAELKELARESKQATLSAIYKDVLTPQYADWLEYEAYATSIRQFETKLVPGVLQTYDYAYGLVAAMAGKDVEDDLVERIVSARLDRGKLLTSADGPSMDFIIDESALRRGVGNESSGRFDYQTMIEQLEQLKRLNTRGLRDRGQPVEEGLNPNIGIQIVPFEAGAYKAMRGPFELLEFEEPEDENMVYFEYPDGDIVIRDSTDASAPYLDMFASMQSSLTAPSELDEQLDTIIDLMKRQQNGVLVRT
jgi:transcriptional regulator with XRE-family HTH domain